MSTRATWAHELAVRAKSAGWRVTKPRSTSGAYKIVMTPCDNALCNHIAQLHLTSSDMNAPKVAEREMQAHGLSKLVEKAETAKDLERAARLDAQRRAADAKAEQLAKRSAMIDTAAGPYAGPQYVDDSWFIADHPAPVTRAVIMTPRQAEWLLENYNNDNRPFYRRTRDHYYDVIKANGWRLTHQGCAMDTTPTLQDGQHRLSAIAKAGVDVPILFTVGADPDNFKAIDEGLLRTAAQLLGKEGESNVRSLAALVKVIWVFDCDDRSKVRTKLTNQQVIDGFGGQREEIRKAVNAGFRDYQRALVKSTNPNATAYAAAHYLLERANGADNPYVEAFFHGLTRERKLDRAHALDERDPRLKLRAYIGNYRAQRKNLPAFDQLCLIIVAWNHVIADRRRENLRWHANQPVPRIGTIAADSPCPPLLEGEAA